MVGVWIVRKITNQLFIYVQKIIRGRINAGLCDKEMICLYLNNEGL